MAAPEDEIGRLARLMYTERMKWRKKHGLPVPNLAFDDLTKEVWQEYRHVADRILADHLFRKSNV